MKSGIIIACLYNDWASAEVLFKAVDLEFSRRDWNWQLVLVDDGSREGRPPDFLNSLSSFTSKEIVVLRRNVGHQRAIAIGLSHIFETKKAETVVVMDADGEDRPEDLVRLVEAHSTLPQEKIIFAERTRRSEGAIFGFLYQIYRTLHFSLTGYKIRFGNFSIIPRKLLGCLVVDPNLWLHFAATVVSGHIPYTTIPSHRGVRLYGKSKLNFTSLVIHGLAAISCYNEIVGVRLIFCSLGTECHYLNADFGSFDRAASYSLGHTGVGNLGDRHLLRAPVTGVFDCFGIHCDSDQQSQVPFFLSIATI